MNKWENISEDYGIDDGQIHVIVFDNFAGVVQREEDGQWWCHVSINLGDLNDIIEGRGSYSPNRCKSLVDGKRKCLQQIISITHKDYLAATQTLESLLRTETK